MQFLHLIDNEGIPSSHTPFVQLLSEQMGKEYIALTPKESHKIFDLESYCEEHSVDMLFISCRNERSAVQRYLNACRTLRLPYLFLTCTMTKVKQLQEILVPVTMLEEEVYKGEIVAHLSRFTGAHVQLLRAKDYGHKAEMNTNRIATTLERFALSYEKRVALTDSFHIHKEVTERQKDFLSDLIVLTASRDYGLDDLLFGPKERTTIRHSQVPILLINPRGDLFSLCD